MVRASASSLAAASTADASPSPASRVADLGQHIDQSLKIHSPVEDVVVMKGEPIEHQVDFSPVAEMLTIPFADQTIKGFVFVREHASDAPLSPITYEAVVFFNGNCVSSVDGCPTRREAITVVEKDLYAKISQTKTFAAESRELNAIIHALNNLSESEHIPAGVPCEWPIDDPQEPTWEGQGDGNVSAAIEAVGATTELPADAAADAAGEACGKEEVVAVVEPVAPPATPVESAEDRKLREKLARAVAEGEYRRRYAAAMERAVESRAHVIDLTEELKAAKKTADEAVAEWSRIKSRGPDYRPLLDAAEVNATNQATTATTTATAPAIPSHESTLPPPVHPEANAASSPFSPQAGEAEPNASTTTDDTATAATTTADPDAWKSASIDALGLPPKLAEKLREAGCPTVGKLEDLRGSFDGLMSIAGIGRTKADQIEEALLGWLSKNRDASTLSAAREAAVAGEAVGLEMAAQTQ